jgi:hypothetical protein
MHGQNHITCRRYIEKEKRESRQGIRLLHMAHGFSLIALCGAFRTAPGIGLAYPKIRKRIQKKCLVIYINMAG